MIFILFSVMLCKYFSVVTSYLVFPLYGIDVFKPLGEKYPVLNNDKYLTLMFSIGAIFGALPLVWTLIASIKRVTYKMAFGALLIIEVLCCVLIELMLKSRFFFGVLIIVANFAMAGIWGLTPNLLKKIFGEATAAQLNGIINVGQGLTIICIELLLHFTDTYIAVFYFIGVLTTIGLLLLIFLLKEEKYHVEVELIKN